MTALRLLVVVGVALALSSCGGEERKAEDEGAVATADRIPAQRRNAPPAGIAEQVSYFEVGDGGDLPTEAAAPSIRFYGSWPREREVEIGQAQFQIFLPGFAPGSPVDVAVRRPDGREVSKQAVKGGYPVHQLPWLPVPGDPVGRYRVTARQGATTVRSSFHVRRASVPRMRTMERYVARGKPVQVAFAGFPARGVVGFHLYREVRAGSGRFSYLASMTARMDRNGEAVREIGTDPASPPARYLVRVTETPRPLEWAFEVGEEPAADG